MNITRKQSLKGFTLLELLIVITIIAVLSVILIVALNPTETLKKSRDTQRLADLASLKTAIGIYTTTLSSPDLDGATGGGAGSTNMVCLTSGGTGATVAYSISNASNLSCTGISAAGNDASGTFSTSDGCYHVVAANLSNIDG